MVRLDFDRLLERLYELNKLDCYVPLVLHSYINQEAYFERVTRDVAMEYYNARTRLMGVSDYNKYLTDDLLEWLEVHDDFQDIII
jgi:hypothetical protein